MSEFHYSLFKKAERSTNSLANSDVKGLSRGEYRSLAKRTKAVLFLSFENTLFGTIPDMIISGTEISWPLAMSSGLEGHCSIFNISSFSRIPFYL